MLMYSVYILLLLIMLMLMYNSTELMLSQKHLTCICLFFVVDKITCICLIIISVNKY